MASTIAPAVFASLLAGVGALKVGLGCDYAGGAVGYSFAQFVTDYDRHYTSGSEEYEMRKGLFERRVADIITHNCLDEHPWKAQVNHMIDWTESELMSLRGYRKAYSAATNQNFGLAPAQLNAEDYSLPDSISWAHLDSIKHPTDQGQCGSCWAYAATAALNAHAEINNKSSKFSVAQIIACTPNPQECGGTGGCEGATAELAYEYAMQAGLVDDATFPALHGGSQAKCPSDKHAAHALLAQGIASKAVITPEGAERHMMTEAGRGGASMGMLGWTKMPENKEMPLVRALVEYGPIAVAVAAGSDWNWYFQGIMTKMGCDHNHVISHAVVLFGYGTAHSVKRGEVKYWHIKNSWGRGWGEEGNLRLQRLDEEEQECGWDNQPEVGSGCKGGPKKVWVCGSCGILYDTVMPMFRE